MAETRFATARAKLRQSLTIHKRMLKQLSGLKTRLTDQQRKLTAQAEEAEALTREAEVDVVEAMVKDEDLEMAFNRESVDLQGAIDDVDYAAEAMQMTIVDIKNDIKELS